MDLITCSKYDNNIYVNHYSHILLSRPPLQQAPACGFPSGGKYCYRHSLLQLVILVGQIHEEKERHLHLLFFTQAYRLK